jgi:single-strand DNA-binding protein
MASLNKVMLIGNLTKDPEVKYLPSGSAVTDLRMAVNRKYRTQDGQDKEETVFVTVAVFGRQAETCGQYLRKGSPAFIEGRLKLDEWEKDGQKRSQLGVIAERVQFLSSGGPRRDAEYGDAAGGSRPPPRPAARPVAPPPAEGAGHEPPPSEGDAEDLPF